MKPEQAIRIAEASGGKFNYLDVLALAAGHAMSVWILEDPDADELLMDQVWGAVWERISNYRCSELSEFLSKTVY